MTLLSHALIRKRFLKKVKKTDTCWLWLAFREGGYGRFWLNGGMMKAHRASYELFIGPIPKGLIVLHKCDNPPCVNPSHIYAGTVLDNAQDAVTRGRLKPQHGEENNNSKLTWDKVKAIRQEKPFFTIANLAEKYSVSYGCISNVVYGTRWRSER